MGEQRPIKHISGALNALGLDQFGVEATPDPVLGFRQWGGKDSAGNVTAWLARNKAGQLLTLQLTGSTTAANGNGFLRHNSAGVVTGGALTPGELPGHNELEGINTEDVLHINQAEKSLLHDPLTLIAGETNLRLIGQSIALDHGTTLQDTGAGLEVDPSKIAHSSLQGLLLDNHPIYSLRDGTRGFSGPVSGQSAQQGDHLATLDDVNAAVESVGSEWLQSVKSILQGSLPGSPNAGDRYIDGVGDSGFLQGSVLEWTGTTWKVDWAPNDPSAVGARTYVEDQGVDYRYTGTGPTAGGWMLVPMLSNHNELLGLGNDDHTQYTRIDGARPFTAAVGGESANKVPTNLATYQDILDESFDVDGAWISIDSGTSGYLLATRFPPLNGDIGVQNESWESEYTASMVFTASFSLNDGELNGEIHAILGLLDGVPSVSIMRDTVSCDLEDTGITIDFTRTLLNWYEGDPATGTKLWSWGVAVHGLTVGKSHGVKYEANLVGYSKDQRFFTTDHPNNGQDIVEVFVEDRINATRTEKVVYLPPEDVTASNGFGLTPVGLALGSANGASWYCDEIEAYIQAGAEIPATAGSAPTLGISISDIATSFVTNGVFESNFIAETVLGTTKIYNIPITAASYRRYWSKHRGVWLHFRGDAPETPIHAICVKFYGWLV